MIEGDNITLSCNVERPSINMYNVIWRKDSEIVENLPPGKFDLELTDVSLSESGAVYVCIVETSIDQPEEGADATAMGITLNVMELHACSKLILHARAIPSLTIFWLFGSLILHYSCWLKP